MGLLARAEALRRPMTEAEKELLARIERLDKKARAIELDPGCPRIVTGARSRRMESRRELLLANLRAPR